ncbi:MAG: sporulation protein YunB [Clostridia bacterium]|nr:sporulation protein YunB [Clostridia bacterium]MBQ7289093.1 sporulation protein YunB [Clostridia bacterium]
MRRGFKHKRRILHIRLLCIVVAAFCSLLLLDRSLRPLIITHTAAQAQNMVDNLINYAVYDYLDNCSYTYSDLSHIIRGTNNEIESIEIDSVKINSMAANIMRRVNDSFDKTDKMTIYIPIGTATGIDFLVGRGPRFAIQMGLTANISADFFTDFTEAGINQTLHSINFVITAQIYLMNKFYQSSVEAENTYIAAQTVIVGEIPSVVANLQTDAASQKTK